MAHSRAAADNWACRGTLVHMPTFAQPELLVDKLVIVGPATQGGRIQEISPGDEESQVCSRFGIDPQDVVQLQVSVRSCRQRVAVLPRQSFLSAGGRVAVSWLHRSARPRAAGKACILP